ncbi:MAG: helicase-related protein [Vicinamibacteria bacterium]
MADSLFHPGQRWISDSEPELGLGSIQSADPQRVKLIFPASGETREYARDNAPLRRVRFHAGDTIKDRANASLRITAVVEREGLFHYQGSRDGAVVEISERDLSDAISFNKPEERLLVGQTDAPDVFDLRVAALDLQYRQRRSRVRGFVGGRIDLIPHQLYIASETSSRLVPRVLLADEVGLGKTIEACLVVHRLLMTGRAHRVLLLVPGSLVHQWLVEMLRRFNHWFRIYNEKRCASIEAANPGANPFLEDQLVLASINLFTQRPHRVKQAVDAGWDVVVVDEAHHLGWTPEKASPEYTVVEALSKSSPGLLLLTATPEQLGIASHFARLRLLDPARFHDLAEFARETEAYREVAKQAAALTDRKALADLLDQHGTGRVMFRNTRATITGFPNRVAHLVPLTFEGDKGTLLERVRDEFESDIKPVKESIFEPDFTADPRIPWLISLLRSHKKSKVLLICRTREKVEAIEAAMRDLIKIRMGMFHEGLTLVQRDRQAAYFAEEGGARLLICSEIGSEGRNFQFSHHLVMFDLPLDPELIEQRIGRLDRIGQTSEIHVHVPFVPGSPQEVLARWFNEGLNSFEKNLNSGNELLDLFGDRVRDLARAFPDSDADARAAIETLISETRSAGEALRSRLETGRDRLLELNSFRPEVAAHLVEDIKDRDQDQSLDAFMIAAFDHFTIQVEEIAPRTYQLGSAGVLADTFPGLPADGLTVTADRTKALSREDLQFLTWDHPLVTNAIDLVLGSQNGNSSFAKWPDSRTSALYVEAVYVLECVAPLHLHIDRFLPPTPIRVMLDHRGGDASTAITTAMMTPLLRRGDTSILQRPEVREELLPSLIAKAQSIADRRVPPLVLQARKTMADQLDQEIQRLRDLQKVNRSVRPEEVDLLIEQKTALDEHLSAARLRLDAIRLIQRGPA